MTILDTLDDPNLLGPAFPDRGSWDAWRVLLAAAFGLPLTPEQLVTFQRFTARQTAPTDPVRELWCIAGRRAGKSRVAALLAVYIAAFKDYSGQLAPGEKATVAVIAADRQQARVVFRYVVGLLDAVPMLRALVVRQTASAVELRGRVVIEVHTCSYRSTRGYSFAAVIADECAFWRDETSASPDIEVLNAVRPGLATIPGSLLVAISSPYSRRGALWTAYKEHFGEGRRPGLRLAGPDPRHEPHRARARRGGGARRRRVRGAGGVARGVPERPGGVREPGSRRSRDRARAARAPAGPGHALCRLHRPVGRRGGLLHAGDCTRRGSRRHACRGGRLPHGTPAAVLARKNDRDQQQQRGRQ